MGFYSALGAFSPGVIGAIKGSSSFGGGFGGGNQFGGQNSGFGQQNGGILSQFKSPENLSFRQGPNAGLGSYSPEQLRSILMRIFGGNFF